MSWPAEGFALAIAECASDATREDLMARSIARADRDSIKVARISAREAGEDVDLVEFLRARIPIGTTAAHVEHLEHLLLDAAGRPRSSPSVEGWNRRRDALPSAISCRLVLWLSPDAHRALRLHARDLADLVASTFRFESPANTSLTPRSEEVPGWRQLATTSERPALEREASLLHARLASTTADLPRAESLLRLGRIAALLGDRDTARREFDAALAHARASGDERLVARCLDQIALELWTSGDWDGALKSWREEALPIHERLGDSRARAITLGKIADVLQQRGQLDEALRIRREEQLPVFERLGEVRERAITLGRIADVLRQRGQLDEALRIRREEELPVYERLGEVRARAMAMAWIADAERQRGRLAEALRIWRSEVRPTIAATGSPSELETVDQHIRALERGARSEAEPPR